MLKFPDFGIPAVLNKFAEQFIQNEPFSNFDFSIPNSMNAKNSLSY